MENRSIQPHGLNHALLKLGNPLYVTVFLLENYGQSA